MRYDNLVKLQCEYNERESKWLEDLAQGVDELKRALLGRMGIAETYLDSADRAVPYLRVLEAQVDQSSADKLSRKSGLPISRDGYLPIAIELKLLTGVNSHLVYMYVGLRSENGSIQYALWDLPGAYEFKSKNWRSLDGILTELELQMGYYFAHDPTKGDRVDLSIV